MKVVHEGLIQDYEILLEMVRKHVEEKARKKNAQAAKNTSGGTGLVGEGKAAKVAQLRPKPKPRARQQPLASAINGQRKEHVP